MISFEGISKSYQVRGHQVAVFADVDIEIPTDRAVAILGAEASGKSALIRMMSGVEGPTRGIINRFAAVSFPVGSVRVLKPHLTGRQNAEHVARIYGVDPREVASFVETVAEMGMHFDEPVRRMPSGLRGALACVISYAIPFDTYLIDETVGFGPERIRDRCSQLLRARAEERAGYILATNRPPKARQLCDCAIVIAERRLHWFDDMSAAEAALKAEVARISSLRRPAAPEEVVDEPLA